MRGSSKYYEAIEQARKTGGSWPGIDIFSDGGADAVGTPEATAEYGWLITADGEGIDVLAEGGAAVRGPPEDMSSNRVEL